MEQIRLTDISQPWFDRAWALYKEAFPLNERRLLKSQTSIMCHPNYHFEVILQDACFLGILFWWGFDDLRFIEHFAILPECRQKGYGERLLEGFKQNDSRPVILEVERPTGEIEQRRIQFYERLGFVLNQHYYEQPAYQEEGQPMQLLLMSYPLGISDEDMAHFIKDYHPIIYGLKLN
ncbi:N-acetyltransferase [Ancylomarina salipaludis]|uniref:N-acetyltransferase n=1 Tax=Ancylomarina salipaludis TaxID=2501299 RepID=A0A4Q1JKY4_9BACT|nr:GNAT family N-acetyltransferase [Ancylomarina salipaludis]RXQ92160.1 N-acetyltransferase [Ancylomarina salipaludis]